MNRSQKPVENIAGWMHRHLLGLLLFAYLAAALVPGMGLQVRGLTLGEVKILGASTNVTMPLVLLGFMLFNAGLGVKADRLHSLLRDPRLLAFGLAANVVTPIVFLHGVAPALGLWHDPNEVQAILIGLTLVAAMPIAGSSTSWSQHSDGDLTLSLGLVLFSTLLSPWITPLVLHAVAPLLLPQYAEAVGGFGGAGPGIILGLFVMCPAVLGMAVSAAVGTAGWPRIRSCLKLGNLVVLLLLIYANAATALPETLADPDLDFLALTVATSAGLCASAFATGWGLGKLMQADESRRTALMFGLGMNNNGTGLVLASLLLAAHPRVLLPLLMYNLVQHLIAGAIARLRSANRDERLIV